MRRLTSFLIITVALAAGCKKDSGNEVDYSKTIFEADPSWQRVAVIPWQDASAQSVRGFSAGDLRIAPSGQLIYAYGEYTTINNGGMPVYKATINPDEDALATVTATGWSVPFNNYKTLFHLDETSGEVSGSLTYDKKLLVCRSNGTVSPRLTLAAATSGPGPLDYKDRGPRYLPHFCAGGQLIFSNDYGTSLTTEIYDPGNNSWISVKDPVPPGMLEWFSFQTKGGPVGFCALIYSNDSLSVSIYYLNGATNSFELAVTQFLPQISGKGRGQTYQILSYNAEESGLVLALANFDQSSPREASVYKMTNGAGQFSCLYSNVPLPAYYTTRFQQWGEQEGLRLFGTSACTPDGQLCDVIRENDSYYLVTVDAGGFHEKARFRSASNSQLQRWPVYYRNGAFYLLAQTTDYPERTNDFRLEILRVK